MQKAEGQCVHPAGQETKPSHGSREGVGDEVWKEEGETPGISWTRSGSPRSSHQSSGLVLSIRALESNQAVGEVSSLAFWGEFSPLERKGGGSLKEERGPSHRDQN